MLRLVNKTFNITEVAYETFQKKNTVIIDTVLFPPPCACKKLRFFSLLKELPETPDDRFQRNFKTFCSINKGSPMH